MTKKTRMMQKGKKMDKDTIYRQDAIDSMANTLWHFPNECYRNLNEYEFAKGLAELGLKSVPSAHKSGKWLKISPANIYECSECGQNVMTGDICAYAFCHGCGADMREGQDDSI